MDHSMHHKSHIKLAFEATTHCLIGCGIGEILAMSIGMFIHLPYLQSIILGVGAGAFFGFLLGIIPLLRSNMPFFEVTKIVLTTESLSILFMEIGEVLIELHFPGMRRSGLTHPTFWAGLFTALLTGFIVAYPVNLYLVKKGVRHIH